MLALLWEKMFLVVFDAHSKWLEVMVFPNTTSNATIQKLRAIFATHGLPEVLVSDNASCFTSAEFKEFVAKNGIHHITSAPYHQASNGLAERAVQTFKEGMKKATPSDIETQLSRFLFHYRITPHSTTGVSPAELLLRRKPRSILNLLQPDVGHRVRSNQARQKFGHDKHAKARQFMVDDSVFIRNFSTTGPTWLPGTIIETRGPLTFYIQLGDGRVCRRHIDHIRHRACETPVTDVQDEIDDNLLPTPASTQSDTSDSAITNSTPTIELRRSTRTRNPPDRFM